MTRLLFVVEGDTEQEYVVRAIQPLLAARGVFAPRPLKVTTRRDGGVKHSGGGLSYPRLKREIEHLLKQHRGPDVRFTTMLDLYGLPGSFPGYAEAEALRHMPRARIERLERALGDDIGDMRLIPHIQLHEFETMLLCNLDDFIHEFTAAERGIKALAEAVSAAGGPEMVNDGEATAPSKRIEAQFPGYRNLKTTAGVEIAVAGLERARSLCPHFDAWIRRLEALGTP